MPHAVEHIPKNTKYHYRRYTWPPSIHLIDVSSIRVPLPDIDDDPFAHFVSRYAQDEDEEHIVYSAGILPSDSFQMHAEKTCKFRASMAGRWKAFLSKYTAKLHRRQEKTLTTKSSTKIQATKPNQVVTMDFVVPTITSMTSTSSTSKQTRPAPLAVQDPLQSSRTRQRMRRSRSLYQRSWHAPSDNLFSISEKGDEDVDEPVKPSKKR